MTTQGPGAKPRRATLARVCAMMTLSTGVLAAQFTTALPVLERTVTIPPTRPITIDATIADLRVTGWTRPDVEITIALPRGGDTSGLDIGIDDLPSALRIRAVQVDGQLSRDLRTSLVVNAPAHSIFERIRVTVGHIVLDGLTGHVTASSRDGEIEATGVAGIVRLETGLGNLTLRQAELVPKGLLRLRAFNGDVNLQLRRQPSDARILALTFNGRIASDIPLVMKGAFGPKSGSASVGHAKPVIAIDVVKGNIAISAPR